MRNGRTSAEHRSGHCGFRSIALGAIAAVVLMAGPAEAWRQRVAVGGGTGYAVAVDAGGDAITAGTALSEFLVVKHAGDTGAELWRVDGESGVARAVATDALGDVCVAGTIGGDLVVLKLDDATGTELWRADLGLGLYAARLVLDSSGDVIASGILGSYPTLTLLVVKLAGSSGAEVWRHEIPMTDDYNSGVQALAVDAADDVVFVATVEDTSRELIARKLAGASGAQVWSTTLGTGSFYGDGHDGPHAGVAVDAGGDVYLTGAFIPAGFDEDMLVAKLAGGDGTEIWRRHVEGDEFTFETGEAVALTSLGDVAAVGRVDNHAYVTLLSGATGTVYWERRPGRRLNFLPNRSATSVAVDGADDILFGGALGGGGRLRFSLSKLDGTNGTDIWRRELSNSGSVADGILALALGSAGDAFVAGGLGSPGELFAGRFANLDGSVGPLDGKKLVVKDKLGDPGQRKIIALLKEPAAAAAPGTSVGDPVLGGAKIRLLNPVTAETATFVLPPGTAYWKALGSPAGRAGYRYVDASGTNGPCKVLLVKPGKSVRFVCAGAGIPFTLDEAGQASLGVVVQLGTAEPQCATFGGTIVRNGGTSNPGPRGIFLARDAAAPNGSCPPAQP